jgi:predicted porin
MKKHLIAAAVAAAVAVPAMAQNVTVYGIIDTSYQSTKTVTNANPGVTAKTTTIGADGGMSGSRLGFRGTEDLGGGMKANFQIEMGFETTNNGMIANAQNRFSFVGLSGGFGEIRLGRFPTLNKLINDATVFGGASFTGAGASNSGWGWVAQANGAGVSNERIDNALHYISPNFSGANVQLQLIDDKNDATTADAAKTKAQGMFAGINYAAGPLALRYANKNVKTETAGVAAAAAGLNLNAGLRNDPVFGLVATIAQGGLAGVPAVAETKVKQDSMLASYDFGVARVVFIHNNTKSSPVGVVSTKRNDQTLGVSVPVGSLTLLGQYGTGTQKSGVPGDADDKLKGLQLGAVYSLSKRTNVYAAYGDGELKDGATGRKATDDIYTFGLRHSF